MLDTSVYLQTDQNHPNLQRDIGSSILSIFHIYVISYNLCVAFHRPLNNCPQNVIEKLDHNDLMHPSTSAARLLTKIVGLTK